ncbi:hypothetical protein E4U37_003733 [Claviceps purpurea]|nr:hypothetical protein E4U37_003733 [Claviceps purpurea]
MAEDFSSRRLTMPEVLNPPLPSLKSGVPEANDARWPEVSEGTQDSALWAAAAPRRVEPPPPSGAAASSEAAARPAISRHGWTKCEQLLVPVDGKTGSEKAGQKRKRNAEASAKSRRNRGKNAIMAEQLNQANRKLQEKDELIQEKDELIQEKDELLREKDELLRQKDDLLQKALGQQRSQK